MMKMIKKSLAMVTVFALALSTSVLIADDEANEQDVVESEIEQNVSAGDTAKEQETAESVPAGVAVHSGPHTCCKRVGKDGTSRWDRGRLRLG